MDKEDVRVSRFLVIVALIISALSLAIAYSAVSNELKINANANNIGYNKWNISYIDVGKPLIIGSAIEVSEPILTSNSISFNIRLNKYLDEISYEFDVENKGKLDAALSSEPIIEGIPSKYREYITCTLIHTDGTKILKDEELLKGTTKRFKIVFKYSKNINVNNLDGAVFDINATLLYIQKI